MAKHRSGATDTVPLRFVSQYARFENDDEREITTESTIESRMNSDASSPSMPGGAPTPPPPNVDFLPDPNEPPTPF